MIKGAILCTPEELNFGTILSALGKMTLPISLLNSADSPVLVSDMHLLVPDPYLTIAFRKHTVLLPNVQEQIATVCTARSEKVAAA